MLFKAQNYIDAKLHSNWLSRFVVKSLVCYESSKLSHLLYKSENALYGLYFIMNTKDKCRALLNFLVFLLGKVYYVTNIGQGNMLFPLGNRGKTMRIELLGEGQLAPFTLTLKIKFQIRFNDEVTLKVQVETMTKV